MANANLSVVMLSPQSLKPYFRNNKLHNKRQITLLARVLRAHGFDQPIVVDKENVIIKGHGRWQAAMEAKIPFVPVVVRDDLEDWEVRAARIADNQSFALSGVDQEKSHQEVSTFVAEGGVGAEFYFDFLQPPKAQASADPAAASSKAVTKAPEVGGLLITCPKCTHVQMETKA